jgi:hypothetical protein
VTDAAVTVFSVRDGPHPTIRQTLGPKPIIDIGWAETRPVVDFADVLSRVVGG